MISVITKRSLMVAVLRPPSSMKEGCRTPISDLSRGWLQPTMKSMLTCAIPTTRNDEGKVINLVSTDVLRFDQFSTCIHFGWMSILDVIVIAVLMCNQVGWKAGTHIAPTAVIWRVCLLSLICFLIVDFYWLGGFLLCRSRHGKCKSHSIFFLR